MKQLQKANIGEFKAYFRGNIILPGDAHYGEESPDGAAGEPDNAGCRRPGAVSPLLWDKKAGDGGPDSPTMRSCLRDLQRRSHDVKEARI